MGKRFFSLLFSLLPCLVLLSQNIVVGQSDFIKKSDTRTTSYFDDFEGFAMNAGLNIGYGRIGMNADGVNYVPFAVDVSAGVHPTGWLTTNIGAAAELEWAPRKSNFHFAVPVYAELQFNFNEDIDEDVYVGLRVGNAFKWYDCMKDTSFSLARSNLQLANLYASLRIGAYLDGMDFRFLEVTYEGQPWSPDGQHMLMISAGFGFRL